MHSGLISGIRLLSYEQNDEKLESDKNSGFVQERATEVPNILQVKLS